jgi:predicted nucleic acid-binding protein
LRAPCRALVEAVRSGRLLATTTPEVIQEFTHIRARRHGRREAVARARDYVALLSPLLTVEETMLAMGLHLYEVTPTLGTFDAILCGAAIAVGATTIVSADRGFALVEGLTHVDPAHAGFEAWLAEATRR